MKYYTLVVNDEVFGWKVQFGDYDRNVVEEERDEYRESYMAGDLKVIATTDSQSDIDCAVAKLNGQVMD